MNILVVEGVLASKDGVDIIGRDTETDRAYKIPGSLTATSEGHTPKLKPDRRYDIYSQYCYTATVTFCETSRYRKSRTIDNKDDGDDDNNNNNNHPLSLLHSSSAGYPNSRSH